jgi:enamine deaminase RidA (YjgF/YER057c/UK114 family)
MTRSQLRSCAAPVPPGSLIGVAALDVPDHLVEVEATAVLD